MKSRALRALLVVVALAAWAGAGYKIWQLELDTAKERSDALDFERKVRLSVLSLTELRSLMHAYVAEGQVSEGWQTKATNVSQTIAPRLVELRAAATSPQAQGAIETAIETFTALGQTDAKARDYIRSNQKLSASDVIFADAASQLTRIINSLDAARGQEVVTREIHIAGQLQLALYVAGAVTGVTLIVLLILLPLPKGAGAQESLESGEAAGVSSSGLGLSQVSPAAPKAKRDLADARTKADTSSNLDDALAGLDLDRAMGSGSGPDVAAVADICSALACVEDPRELHGLLERTAKALDATGLIIWMPEGAAGALRPVLAYGYAPLSLTRMGAVDPAADNATAVAYRTKTVQMLSAEPMSNGAVVAPLVTSDGCSGAMALELKQGVGTTPHLKAMAEIVAAQLATLITPAGPGAIATPAGASAGTSAGMSGGTSAGTSAAPASPGLPKA